MFHFMSSFASGESTCCYILTHLTLNSVIWQLQRHLNALDSNLFRATCAPLVPLYETRNIICNLLCTYAILSPCSQKLFPLLFFGVLLIPISLYNLLRSPERRNSSLFCFSSQLLSCLGGLIEKWKMYPSAHKLGWVCIFFTQAAMFILFICNKSFVITVRCTCQPHHFLLFWGLFPFPALEGEQGQFTATGWEVEVHLTLW